LIDNPSYQDFATHDDSAYPELWDGCVGAWAPCLGPSGTRLHDHSGGHNWGEFQFSTPANDWQVGSGQYAINFDGADNNVRIDRNLLENPSQTCTAWVRGATFPNAYNTVICKNEDNNRYWAILIKSNGKLAYYVHANAPVFVDGSGAFTLLTEKWYFVAMSYSASAGLSGYVDGRLDGTAAANGDPTTGSSFVNIGSHYQALVGGNSGRFFNGLIDDVKVYRRILRPSEIFELYRLGRGGIYAPRRRRPVSIFFGPSFNAAWARGSNVILQPSVGVA
jgi:hypothetical protein